jgi:hypothetical protein
MPGTNNPSDNNGIFTHKDAKGHGPGLYNGRMTHYNTQLLTNGVVGQTACNDLDTSHGDMIDGEMEYTAALPFMKMGNASWGNRYCGSQISIWYSPAAGPNRSVQATVRDKCFSCVGFQMDLDWEMLMLLVG